MSVVITQAPLGVPGREMKALWNRDTNKARAGGRASAWTPCHDRQPLGRFIQLPGAFWASFYLLCLPAHPLAHLWMALQMICVQFGITQANTDSKNRLSLPHSQLSACLSYIPGRLNLFSTRVGLVLIGWKRSFEVVHFKEGFNKFHVIYLIS